MKSAHFQDITQSIMVIPYRHFGKPYLSHFNGQEIQEEALNFLNLKDGIDKLSRNVGKDLQQHAIPEERRSHRNSCVSHRIACISHRISYVSHGPLFLIHRLLIKIICVMYDIFF
jgi:hypothetical protein